MILEAIRGHLLRCADDNRRFHISAQDAKTLAGYLRELEGASGVSAVSAIKSLAAWELEDE